MRALVVVIAAAAAAFGQQDERGDSRLDALRRSASQMIAGMRQLGDWDVHYDLITDSVERVYDRNGWDTEADLFSLEMMRDVSAIPPWEIQQRFDRVVEVLSDRYFLNDRQERIMRQTLLRENNALFMRHSDRIMTYAMEAIQTRAAGEPFSPDQVARWAELAMPVFRDSQKTMRNAAQEFSQVLDPEQRELLDADLTAANRRMDDMATLGQEWLAGNWKAEDWGLEDDPIQQRMLDELIEEEPAVAMGDPEAGPDGRGGEQDPTMPRAPGALRADDEPQQVDQPPRRVVRNDPEPPPPPPGEDVERERPRGGKAADDDAWTKYVKDFIAKYDLNEEQQQHAWLFHKASKDRADAVRTRFARLAKSHAGAAERMKVFEEQRDSDLERLFDALKQRLERLPTRAQRRAALAEDDAAGRKP